MDANIKRPVLAACFTKTSRPPAAQKILFFDSSEWHYELDGMAY
jgi:hypothetical protein